MPRGHIEYEDVLLDVANEIYCQDFSNFFDVGDFFANYPGYDFGEYAEDGWEDAVFEDIDYHSITKLVDMLIFHSQM